MSRDADQTQKRILRAALNEFSEKGLAGARVDSIAKRAKTSVRMLYHYFGNKEELFDEVLRDHVDQRWQGLATPLPLNDFIAEHFSLLVNDVNFVRLVVWESLGNRRRAHEADIRETRYRSLVEHLRSEQTAGRLDGEFDAELVMILIVALTSFPVAFPDITSMITGEEPESRSFQERYKAFLTTMADRLGPSAAPTTAEERHGAAFSAGDGTPSTVSEPDTAGAAPGPRSER